MAQDREMHLCFKRASTIDDAMACVDGGVERMIGCTTGLFDNLWKTYPNAKIGQYNYMATAMDESCQEENCLEAR